MGKQQQPKQPKQPKPRMAQSAHLLLLVKRAFMAIGALALFTIALMIIMLVNTNARLDQLAISEALNTYRNESQRMTSEIQSYAITSNSRYLSNYNQHFNEGNRDAAIELLRTKNIKDSEWVKLNLIIEKSNSLIEKEAKAKNHVLNGQSDLAKDIVFSAEYLSASNEIFTLTDEIIKEINLRTDKTTKTLRVFQIFCSVMEVSSVFFAILEFIRVIGFANVELLQPVKKVSAQMIALADGNFEEPLDMEEDDTEVGKMVASINFMKKNMSDVIEEIAAVMEEMSNGNYRVSLEQNYVGRFGLVKTSIEHIVSKMQETLTTLRDAAEHINTGSEQLADAAQELADGSTTQAMQVSELIDIMKQMTNNMEDNALRATDSVKIASEAGAALQHGNEKMEELKTAIANISSCAEQIKSIIDTIDDIASQTNLLSLNAAIEAARAGEAGRGFAVVAEQVKKLAEESSVASGNTNVLIATTLEAVQNGISIANETTESMKEVMHGAMVATQNMEQIAERLNSEVKNIASANETINTVSAVVDNNSATSEETAAVSQEQRSQVETMIQLMDFFEV